MIKESKLEIIVVPQAGDKDQLGCEVSKWEQDGVLQQTNLEVQDRTCA